MTFRRLLARLHWWSGLVAMPVVLCVALSGALLSISPWLLAATMPRARDARAAPLPESALLERSDLPWAGAVASIEWGGRDRALLLTLRSGERWFVDPADGSALARWRGETPLEHAIGVAHEFHVRLFAGPAGRWMVDLAAVVVLFSAVSGPVLWWKAKRLRIARASRGRRWWRDLHDVTGFYASLVIVALALSGVLLAWEEPLYWLAGAQPIREPVLPHSHSPAPGAPANIGVDQWLAVARHPQETPETGGEAKAQVTRHPDAPKTVRSRSVAIALAFFRGLADIAGVFGCRSLRPGAAAA